MEMKSSDTNTVEASKRRFSSKRGCGFLKEGRGRLYLVATQFILSKTKKKGISTLCYTSF
ncbi:hypothetical protein DVH24_023624 [Malus domestica]|uniref:Uncharacterized protein n=1 Tax=Malus domestica TaxID=3750 RepID=A0A498I2G0_MALDO|nr:hypothetical protein DVH24_023624 [Malus domestica]